MKQSDLYSNFLPAESCQKTHSTIAGDDEIRKKSMRAFASHMCLLLDYSYFIKGYITLKRCVLKNPSIGFPMKETPLKEFIFIGSCLGFYRIPFTCHHRPKPTPKD